MDLETYIEETLVAICNGIRKAKEKINDLNSLIAPGRIEGKKVYQTRLINFEVIVTVNENKQIQVDTDLSGKASMGIAKGELKVAGDFGKTTGEAHHNRISFSIPYLPEGIYENSKGNSK
ncbi:hypothetical protein A8135_05730 [Legionella jamestowniensis]|uniref:Uncharacterized protein n=1 Tax=Legionella jamestowniensis TaxID=455 RepID=A0ABX2XR89_9GAMM|nr:hypothetical protein [Legionella jamestowniensis]OCH97127.1 hypothetical protein A8135_05730 [Legionella jamestowniensis]